MQKNDPVKILIEDYKKLISKTQLKDEIYKWKLVNEYRGRPNTETSDFFQEIKGIKFKNLIYAMGIAVINHLAKDKPEELRQLFNNLYDDSKDLTERVRSFNKETLKIYRELGETLGHHQDERTIATYLTFYNPEKYTLYKASYYKKYCELLAIPSAKTKEKYAHYLTLIDDLIDNYIAKDDELIGLVKKLMPDYYNGINHKLLAQDIIFQMLDTKKETNYWIFQANPKMFDFETALRDNILTNWTVKAHKDKIKAGDKVILWITGDRSGCYALAEVTSEPYEKTASPDDHLWISENNSSLKADIKIVYNLIDNPILSKSMHGVKKLEGLSIGHQGTNFSATKEEYQTILNLSKIKQNNLLRDYENEFKKWLINKYGEKSGTVSSYVKAINILSTLLEKNLFTILDDSFFEKLYTDLRIQQTNIDGKYYYPDAPSYGTNGFYSASIKSYREFLQTINEIEPIMKNDNINVPLKTMNTILYGPPGTGKTHILKNKYMDMFTASDNSVTREDFLKDIIQNCSWWQVIALAVLELRKTKVSDIFNHEYIQIKSQLSNSANVRATIWGQLQSHTVEECKSVNVSRRMNPMIFSKTEKSEWEILQYEVEEQIPELLELKSQIENFENIPNKRIERFEFITFHQSYSYEDFIEGIKPELSESDVSYTIEEGIFQKMCNRARNDSSHNYAIFVDEINRGNISSIFGELITLIEDDKREGASNEIKAILPYSKKPFSVPKNLYIIGTMNTADRSVEGLDTALRRRFSFIEMNPEPAQLNNDEFKCNGLNLAALLIAINARIEKLLDKDYCIGHSYFMTIKNREEPLEEIKIIFQNKILPLLQEYFYGDWGKILLVIGKAFVETKKDSIKFLSTDSYEDFEEYDEKPIYNFTNPSDWSLESFKSVYE